jgi:hypothetical protein
MSCLPSPLLASFRGHPGPGGHGQTSRWPPVDSLVDRITSLGVWRTGVRTAELERSRLRRALIIRAMTSENEQASWSLGCTWGVRSERRACHRSLCAEGFGPDCDAPYCYQHWHVSASGYVYCYHGHGKSLDPHRSQ